MDTFISLGMLCVLVFLLYWGMLICVLLGLYFVVCVYDIGVCVWCVMVYVYRSV